MSSAAESSQAAAPAPAAAPPVNDKRKKAAEKAARRAAVVAQKAAGGEAPDAGKQQQQQSGAKAGPSAGQKQQGGATAQRQKGQPREGQASKAAAAPDAPTASAAAAPGAAAAAAAPREPEQPSPLQLFLHLDTSAPSTSLAQAARENSVHPAIAVLALKYAEFKIVGANARCIAMLEAFKEVIKSYQVPFDANFTRGFPQHLSPQITHLRRARPLSVSMANAIRYVKYEVSLINSDVLREDEAKATIIGKIDAFMRDRIELAGRVIEQHAISKVKDGDVILTYGRSSVVESVLLAAKARGTDFEVVVCDAGPMHEGKQLLKMLRAAFIRTTYVLLTGLAATISRVTLCFLGTHSLLSNGAMFARAGTATVAMMARERGVAVVCCCETYKFSERVMVDSIVGNEMAAPRSLVDAIPVKDRPKQLFPLSLLYDVARPEDVTALITEAGIIPVESVPIVLRDYKPIMLAS